MSAQAFNRPVKSPQTLAAEKKLRDILDELFFNTSSLTHALVKAYRSGMPAHSGDVAFDLVGETLQKAHQAYKAAINQPENKIAERPQVDL